MSAACHRRVQPMPMGEDGGGIADAFEPSVDTDGDGLCDGQELSRGLRIDDPDSDGDGYSDWVEVSLGFDPLRPSSPNRDRIVLLEEGSTARATVTVVVRGMGETFYGSFQATRRFVDDGSSAADFFTGAAAVGAEPMGNVYAIEDQRFVRVLGRTALVFEMWFALAENPRDCLRAYPFEYVVKRDSDGRIGAMERFTLVVAPAGMRPGSGTWCAPEVCD